MVQPQPAQQLQQQQALIPQQQQLQMVQPQQAQQLQQHQVPQQQQAPPIIASAYPSIADEAKVAQQQRINSLISPQAAGLQSLSVGDLRKRAEQAGVAKGAIEDAR